jgi:hypothetical protein
MFTADVCNLWSHADTQQLIVKPQQYGFCVKERYQLAIRGDWDALAMLGLRGAATTVRNYAAPAGRLRHRARRRGKRGV